MTRRFLISSLAVGLLALGGLNAQASQINLPTTLATLETPGNFAIVDNLEFSNFEYVATPPGSPPLASGVTVSPFQTIPGETGITFKGGFFAAAGTIVDYAFTYKVTALSGTITDAYLALTGGVFGGTGSISVGETIRNAADGAFLGSMEASIPGLLVTSTSWTPGVTSILVTKDVILVGGSQGATVSIIDQGFSQTVIPEPASMALLGIGLTGLFTLRRFFKRTSVA